MNEIRCGVPEERWVDWLRKRLPPETAAAMERHLEGCPECRLVYREWEDLFRRGEPDDAGMDGAMPAERVRNAVYRKWRMRTFWRRTAARPVRLAFGAAAAVLVLAGIGLYRYAGGEMPEGGTAALQPKAYAELHQPEGAALMARPDTVIYTVSADGSSDSPSMPGYAQLKVWLNGRTEEMFILLEGLQPEDSRDVQAWAAAGGGLTNLGLVEFHRAQGYLYSHFGSMPPPEELVFTVEPKGGSLQPTSAASVHFRLAGYR